MKKKSSTSQLKPRLKKTPKKKSCPLCQISSTIIILIQNALYRKYSSSHFTEHQLIDQTIKKSKWQTTDLFQQHMQKYHKSTQHKQQFGQILELHKLYQYPPLLSITDITKTLIKSHHRKRLLQYFKIAKLLGIKLDTIKFSTFMLSLSHSHQLQTQTNQNYDALIGQISGYDFTENVERKLIETLQNKENNKYASNTIQLYTTYHRKELSTRNLCNNTLLCS